MGLCDLAFCCHSSDVFQNAEEDEKGDEARTGRAVHVLIFSSEGVPAKGRETRMSGTGGIPGRTGRRLHSFACDGAPL